MRSFLRKLNLLYYFALLCLFAVGNGDVINEVKKVHQWAVSIDGGEEAAKLLAQDLGLTYKHQVGNLNVYLLEGQWPNAHRISAYSHPIRKREAHTQSESWVAEISDSIKERKGVEFCERQIAKKRVKRNTHVGDLTFNDPVWPKSWYLIQGAKGGYDMNVKAAWQAGYTGVNVVVTILDDGIEKDHPDLAPNYDPEASRDINANDDDPSPRYDSVNTNRHGTRCAGQVAAVANNNVCTVGVAFNAKIGGVRMLDGGITDAVEAASLSLNPNHIDIYSASWGPDDNGRALDGPGVLAKKAFVDGVLKGRNGKGNIFVWASGNGGNADDSCACDGYANSIFTLSISSASENGVKPWYLEECASTIATTYSSGEPSSDRQIITTDLKHLCTERHTGTSASAPIAGGMVALALEANPQLTWRDVQHIVAETARPEPLNDANWVTNGLGRKFSTRYGYGLMDGLAMVRLAEKWKQVPEQKICVAYLDEKPHDINGDRVLKLEATVDACEGSGDYVRYLEHVQAQMSLDFSRRGDLTIYLTSPSGTRSQLIPRRSHDRDSGEYKEWPFMSVQFWGESGKGTWKVEIMNTGSEVNRGTFKMLRLVLYGTLLAPESSSLPRKDAAKYSSGNAEAAALGTPPTFTNQTNSGCHPECEAESGCTGQSAADCRQCRHYKTANGVCIPSCLPQFYRDEATKTCVACTPHCTTCASAHHCATCQHGLLLSPDHSQCLHECPKGYCQDVAERECESCPGRCPQGFYEKWIWGCAPCHESCRTCTAGGGLSCLTCRVGLLLDRSSKRCLPPKSKCAPNEFELGNHKCTRCHPTCRTCGGGTDQDCTSCGGSAFFHNGTCVMVCPKHYAAFEVLDETDATRLHRQCMYCFNEDDSAKTSCMPLQLRNDNALSLNFMGTQTATVVMFTIPTVVIVGILLYRRLKGRWNFRFLNGKQYSRMSARHVRFGPSGGHGSTGLLLGKGKGGSPSQRYSEEDEIEDASNESGELYVPSRNHVNNGQLGISSDSDVIEFDTMPELYRQGRQVTT